MATKPQKEMNLETRARYLTVLLLFAIYRYYHQNHNRSNINIDLNETAIMTDIEAALSYLKQNGRDGMNREVKLLVLITELSLDRREQNYWKDKITNADENIKDVLDFGYIVLFGLMKSYGITNILTCHEIIHDAAKLDCKPDSTDFILLKRELTELVKDLWIKACPFLPEMVSSDEP